MKKLAGILLLNFVFVIISAQSYVSNIQTEDGNWGYINMQGEQLIEPIYGKAHPFSEDGFAVVEEAYSKEKYYINLKGERLDLDCAPLAIKKFENGMAPVRLGDYWGFIDTKGVLVIPAEYSHVSYFSNERALVRDENKNIFLLDKAGNKTDLKELKILAYKDFVAGLARVKVDDSWGYINTQGEMAIDAIYSKTADFSDGLAAAKVGKGKFGYINKQGEYVIEPQFDVADDFDPSTGLARVKMGKSWMYVDKQGNKLTIDADHFHSFSEGLLRADKASEPGVYGFVNAQGEWVIQPQFQRAGDFHYGVCRVRINDMWGLIDKEGNIIVEAKYDRFEDFVKVE